MPLRHGLVHAVAGYHVPDAIPEAVGWTLLHQVLELLSAGLLVAVIEGSAILAGQIVEKFGGENRGRS